MTAVPALESKIESPEFVPGLAPDVRDLLDKWWGRIERIVIERFISRGKYHPLNGFNLAANDSGIRKNIDDLVMTAAQYDWESTAPVPQTYRVMLTLDNPDKVKNPPRKSAHFSIGGQGGEVWDNSDPGRVDAEIMRQNGDLHDAILEMTKVVSSGAATLYGRIGDSYDREREAARQIAENNIELERIKQENQIVSKEIEQKDELLKMLKPAAGHISEAVGLKAAEFMDGGRDDEEDEDDDEEGDEKKIGGVRKLSALKKSDETKPANKPGEARRAKLKKEHPHAYTAQVFGDTIRSRQWFKITQVLSKAQIKHFEQLTKAKTNGEALDRFRIFRSKLKDEQFEELKEILEPPQQTMIGQLYMAASAEEKTEDE